MKQFTENELVHPSEKKLFIFSAIFSTLIWVLLTVFTIGIGLLYVAFIALFVALAHGFFLARLKGYGVKISETQFPEIYKIAEETAGRMGMDTVPDIYLYHMDGMLNAFATHFFSRNFVILTSAMMDACGSDAKKTAFILGHEMAHLKRKHTRRIGFLAPSRILPWLGSAYSRACEYTCDAYGAYYGSESVDEGVKAVQVLAAGNAERANAINWEAYETQLRDNRGFFSTIAEVGSSHPFTAKRTLHLRRVLGGEDIAPVRHSFFGLICSIFFNLQFWVGVYIVGVLATISLATMAGYKEKAMEAQARLQAHQQLVDESLYAADSDYALDDEYSAEAEAACSDLYDVYLGTDYDSPEEAVALTAYNKCGEDFDAQQNES